MGILSFEIKGLDSIKMGLAELDAKVKDLRPFWRDVFAPKYLGMVQDLFSTSGTPRGPGGKFTGGPWARLSPKYFVWKEKHYAGKPTLTRTGDLRESLRWSGSMGYGGIFDAQPTHAIVGTAVPYGKFHQTGTKHMPKRNFLPPPDPAVFAPLMAAWLTKKK